jgi:hypothetical protein
MVTADASGSALPPALAERIVERAMRIPSRYRAFTVSEQRAEFVFRIPRGVLVQLVALGLPCADSGGKLTFDRKDLKNALQQSGLVSPQRATVESVAGVLDDGERADGVRRSVKILGRCPEPGHAGPCDFAVVPGLTEPAAWTSAVEVIAPNQVKVELNLASGPPSLLPLTEEQSALFAEITALEFHNLPAELIHDFGFMKSTGLADCRSAYNYLAHRAGDVGLSVRPVAGLIVTKPFSITHSWIEILVEEEWRPADPFFLTALARWGVIDAGKWPAHRSPLGILWRIGEVDDPLMTHRGEAIEPVCLTT